MTENPWRASRFAMCLWFADRATGNVVHPRLIRQRPRRRRAMTLIELTMSLMILGVATVAMIQLLATTARQRRMAQERRAALTELANQAERFSLLSWEEAAPGKLMSWQPSGELAAMLPAAECSVGIVEETESPRSRQIRLQVSWTDGVGLPVTPLGLTMWKFAREDRP